MPPSTIYDYITQQENSFETEEIQVGENWFWNFRSHVQLIFHLMHGVFFTGENNWLRAFKQVMRPLIRLSIWTEDLEVKDVVFYIEETTGRVLSFLIKKYHDEVYTREHDLDTLFDDITESDIAFGGALVQKGVDRPEVIPLQSVAFGDQTNLLGGPIGFKHYFSPSKLREMSKFGWGKESNGATTTIENLITLATQDKEADGTLSERKNNTPGKNIEVYIVKGDLPEAYLNDNDNVEDWYGQVQIVALYSDSENKKQGQTLYRKRESDSSLMVHISEPVYQRALGWSDGEALLHPQIWTNFSAIYKMGLVEAAGKVPLVTDDPAWTTKNKIQDMENLEVTTIEEGRTVQAIQTAFTGNFSMFESTINELYESAQLSVSAFDPLMGKEESAGTTFRGQNQLVAQGRGWHDRRRGQRAKFIEKLYRAWIIPDMKKEILKGKKFLATLSTEEMSWMADQLATNAVNARIKEIILNGKMITKEEQDTMTQLFKQDFMKKGNKHLLEILKDELEDVEIKMGVNIAGKQKNLSNLSDKVLSILQAAMTNPQFKQNLEANGMLENFNDLLEYSGMSPANFAAVTQMQQNPQAVPSPIQPQGQGQQPQLLQSANQPTQ